LLVVINQTTYVSMKKMFLSALMLLGINFAATAQWSSMTIVNHSGCDYNVRLGANFDDGTTKYTTCNFENQDLVVPAGATFAAPDYWTWDGSVSPFVFGSPSRPSTYVPAGTSAPWGTAGCFSWEAALIWPAGTAPGGQVPHPCGFTHYVGTGLCGPNSPSPAVHIWSKNPATGDVTLDLY
jgi:hypothetical protein